MNLLELNGKWLFGGGEVILDPEAGTIDPSGPAAEGDASDHIQFHVKL